MRVLSLILILSVSVAHAQDVAFNASHQKFFFGTAIGASAIGMEDPFNATTHSIGLSFPNFKIGYSLNSKLVLGLYLPGSIYTYKGPGRSRERGFEGIIPFAQFWPYNRYWIMAGAGLTFDAPAFYDIKNESEADFYFGPSVLVATGYEIWQKRKFALDLQTKIHLGFSSLPEGRRNAAAFSLAIGFNWY